VSFKLHPTNSYSHEVRKCAYSTTELAVNHLVQKIIIAYRKFLHPTTGECQSGWQS